jgi:LacI family transcriptional regulator
MQRHSTWRLEVEMETDDEVPRPDIGKDWKGDGIITFRYTDEEAASWRRRGTAVVNVSTEKASTPLPSVFLDNLEAGRQAARFFLERGWDSFGYLHDPHRRYSTERLDGFREVLGEHGHEVDVLEVDSSRMSSAERPEGVRDALRRQIDGWKHPVAVLTKDDISASALLRYLPEFGLSCPDDVAVIGVSNDRLLCLTSFPSLSSVRYPAHQIGYGAAGLLDRQLAGESIKPSQEVTLAPREVRERQSSTRFVSTDKLIASALEFIGREAPGRVVRVEELWERTGVSRESFRKRFLAVVGASPKKEVDRVRVETAKNYLAETRWAIAEISEHMGFGTSEEFSRFFRRAVGRAPTEYRSVVAHPGG